MTDDEPVHDVVVVGGGAAGLAAAVYTARAGLETVVFARGRSAIHQCAHLENYLGFPGGVSPDRFLALGRTHAEHEGATVHEERVESVEQDGDDGVFTVVTAERTVGAERVVAASVYDGEHLDGFGADPTAGEGPFVDADEMGRTAVEGPYATGRMAGVPHQALVCAGHGARTGLAAARDALCDRFWDAYADRYVDWVVHEGRYGGEGWDEHVDEWFDEELLPDAPDDPELVAEARETITAEFLGRQVDDDERERRDREGQHLLLERLDDDVIREYVDGRR